MQKRNRSYVLTDKGLQKLENAIDKWEQKNGVHCTREKMRELTIGFLKVKGLDCGTISKILNHKVGVDKKSIKVLLNAFARALDDEAFKFKENDDITRKLDDDITDQIKTEITRSEELMCLSTKILKELGFEEKFEISKSPQPFQSIRYRTKDHEQGDNPYKLILYSEKESLCISMPINILSPHLLNIKYWEYSNALGEPGCFLKDWFWVLPSKKDVFLDSLNQNYLHLLQVERKTVGDCCLNSIKRYTPPLEIQWQSLYYNDPDPYNYYAVSSIALDEYNPETFSQRDSYLVFTFNKRFEAWNFYKVSISSEEMLKEFLDYFGKILIYKKS